MHSEFGQWRGAGKVTRSSKKNDGVRKESWSISLEIVSRAPGFGRIELAGTMGIYGGTIAWTPQGTRLLLPTMRKFIYSATSSTAFRSVLPVELSPLWLERIVFRNEFDADEMKRAGFECVKQSSELREVCRSEGARVERRYDSDGRIYIVASSQSVDDEVGTLELELSEVRSKVQERDALWILEPPAGFKVVGRPKSSL